MVLVLGGRTRREREARGERRRRRRGDAGPWRTVRRAQGAPASGSAHGALDPLVAALVAHRAARPTTSPWPGWSSASAAGVAFFDGAVPARRAWCWRWPGSATSSTASWRAPRGSRVALRRVPRLHARPPGRGGCARRVSRAIYASCGPGATLVEQVAAGEVEMPVRSGIAGSSRCTVGGGRAARPRCWRSSGRSWCRTRAPAPKASGSSARSGWFERPERIGAAHRRRAAQRRAGDVRPCRSLLLLVVFSFATAAQRVAHVYRKHTRGGERGCDRSAGGSAAWAKVRVAIIGVGNCASSFVQGVHYYRNAKANDRRARADARQPRRLPHPRHRVHRPPSTSTRTRSGKDLVRGHLHLAQQHLQVRRGAAHRRHGAARHDARRPRQVPVADHPEGARLDGGHRQAAQGHQDRRGGELPAGGLARRPPSGTSSRCSRPAARFVNCIPVFIAREKYWQQRFEKRGLPVIGDDIKSQVGATIMHRVLTRLFVDRGVRIDRTYQLNFGGNTDFLNMLERERLESKKISQDQRRHQHHPATTLPEDDVHVGPSRLRAVAEGPQVVPHPHGGHDLRRRAAEPRDEARSVGLAQLGRRRHRRGALRQAGARPRAQGRADRAVVLLHEVAADAVPRRRGARADRGVHPRPEAAVPRSGCAGRVAPARSAGARGAGRRRRRSGREAGAPGARRPGAAANARPARSGSATSAAAAAKTEPGAASAAHPPAAALAESRVPGLFVTFEGGEGSGKTTQLARLADAAARARSSSPCVTREPGGTPLAEGIRALLLDPARAPGRGGRGLPHGGGARRPGGTA